MIDEDEELGSKLLNCSNIESLNSIVHKKVVIYRLINSSIYHIAYKYDLTPSFTCVPPTLLQIHRKRTLARLPLIFSQPSEEPGGEDIPTVSIQVFIHRLCTQPMLLTSLSYESLICIDTSLLTSSLSSDEAGDHNCVY